MNKYNLKIIVPILNKTYEIFAPNNILVGNLLYMFIKSLEELNNVTIEGLLLYNSFDGEKIDLSSYVFNVINNGDVLVLV